MEMVKHFKYLGSLVKACDGVLVTLAVGLLKHLGLLTVFMLLCLLHRTYIGDEEDDILICSVGSVVVRY